VHTNYIFLKSNIPTFPPNILSIQFRSSYHYFAIAWFGSCIEWRCSASDLIGELTVPQLQPLVQALTSINKTVSIWFAPTFCRSYCLQIARSALNLVGTTFEDCENCWTHAPCRFRGPRGMGYTTSQFIYSPYVYPSRSGVL